MGVAGLVSAAGAFPGVAWPLILAVAIAGALYNGWLARALARPRRAPRRRAAVFQAYVDMAMLTIVLWAAGGVRRRSSRTTSSTSRSSGSSRGARDAVRRGRRRDLSRARWRSWIPCPRSRSACGIPSRRGTCHRARRVRHDDRRLAYIVTHAVGELRNREQALARARDRSGSTTTALDDAPGARSGPRGRRRGRRGALAKQARRRARAERAIGEVWSCPAADHACERDVTGVCPVEYARGHGLPGRAGSPRRSTASSACTR